MTRFLSAAVPAILLCLPSMLPAQTTGLFEDLESAPLSTTLAADASVTPVLLEDSAMPIFGRWSGMARAELTYLKPHFKDIVVNPISEGLLELEAAPRYTAGTIRDDGWGFQGRFFDYDADGRSQFIQVQDFVSYEVELNMYSVDFEALKRIEGERWGLQATLGARHASFSRQRILSGINTAIGNPFVFFIDQDTTFQGTGITGSLEATRRLGATPWRIFVNGRGFGLWGTEKDNSAGATFFGGTFTPNGLGQVIDASQIGLETQAGIEWRHDLSFLHGTVVARTAFEYQMWNTSSVDPLGNQSQLDTSLFGTAFSVGFTH
jgi:hypothetical protein